MTNVSRLDGVISIKGAEEANRKLASVDASGKRTAASVSAMESRFSHLDSTIGDFNRSMMFTKNVIGLVKFPAMIAGAGLATQAIGALGASAIGLGSALGPLTGLAGCH
jgi:hypothetical protein